MYLAKTYLSGGGGHKTRLSGQHKIYLKFLDMIFLSYELWFNISYIFIQSVSPQGDFNKKLI